MPCRREPFIDSERIRLSPAETYQPWRLAEGTTIPAGSSVGQGPRRSAPGGGSLDGASTVALAIRSSSSSISLAACETGRDNTTVETIDVAGRCGRLAHIQRHSNSTASKCFEPGARAIVEEVCRHLGESQTALQNHDFVLLADILQYEMDGAVADWMSLREATVGVIEPVNG